MCLRLTHHISPPPPPVLTTTATTTMPKSKTKKIQENQQAQAQAHPKRLTVTDSSGWTHVTTTTRARRLYQNPSPSHPELHPAETPKDLTLAGLQTLFARHHERWLASRSWAHVRDVLLASSRDNNNNNNNAGPVVAHLVAISLGSFSGFLRGGWVDRRTVSMDQLAALVSIRDLLSASLYLCVFFFFFYFGGLGSCIGCF